MEFGGGLDRSKEEVPRGIDGGVDPAPRRKIEPVLRQVQPLEKDRRWWPGLLASWESHLVM